MHEGYRLSNAWEPLFKRCNHKKGLKLEQENEAPFSGIERDTEVRHCIGRLSPYGHSTPPTAVKHKWGVWSLPNCTTAVETCWCYKFSSSGGAGDCVASISALQHTILSAVLLQWCTHPEQNWCTCLKKDFSHLCSQISSLRCFVAQPCKPIGSPSQGRC